MTFLLWWDLSRLRMLMEWKNFLHYTVCKIKWKENVWNKRQELQSCKELKLLICLTFKRALKLKKIMHSLLHVKWFQYPLINIINNIFYLQLNGPCCKWSIMHLTLLICVCKSHCVPSVLFSTIFKCCFKVYNYVNYYIVRTRISSWLLC